MMEKGDSRDGKTQLKTYGEDMGREASGEDLRLVS